MGNFINKPLLGPPDTRHKFKFSIFSFWNGSQLPVLFIDMVLSNVHIHKANDHHREMAWLPFQKYFYLNFKRKSNFYSFNSLGTEHVVCEKLHCGKFRKTNFELEIKESRIEFLQEIHEKIFKITHLFWLKTT